MAAQYAAYPPTLATPSRLSWSGIFAGTFLFLAIEVTFGVLGVAIFTQAINPNSARPIGSGIGIGSGIWMVVLSIIALYFAGKLASKVSGSITRNSGMYAGLVTFGMCIFASVLILSVASGNNFPFQAHVANVHAASIANFLMVGGYWLFATLVLGMIAAASGGMQGSLSSVGVDRTTEQVIETKRVA